MRGTQWFILCVHVACVHQNELKAASGSTLTSEWNSSGVRTSQSALGWGGAHIHNAHCHLGRHSGQNIASPQNFEENLRRD